LRPVGPGKGPNPLVDWSMDGQFKLGEHEGVGTDAGRDPVGGLTSDKSKASTVDSGQATYDQAKKDFVGTFEHKGKKFTGQYTGVPVAEAATGKPVQLGSSVQKPCPDGGRKTRRQRLMPSTRPGNRSGMEPCCMKMGTAASAITTRTS